MYKLPKIELIFNKVSALSGGLAKLKLPEGKFTVANGDLTAAIDESKKPQPDNKKIESRFNNVIETIREAGKTETVSKWDTTKKILTILGKIGLSILL